ncbi:MAG: hypothetical protein AVDCRST_MAG88-3218, partial [uncultured Thermomicrobiales bacterium]
CGAAPPVRAPTCSPVAVSVARSASPSCVAAP